MDIDQAIRQVVREFDQHPYDINNGNCEEFAERVCELVPGAEKLWGEQCPDALPAKTYDGDAHAFIVFDGVFFDAEEPCGVSTPRLLPLFARQAAVAQELLPAVA